MSSDHTDVSSLAQKLSKIYDQAFGYVSVSVPENEETLLSTNCEQQSEPKYEDCHIFDYQEFEYSKRLSRPGSEKDVERLNHDFKKLGFNVYTYLNLPKQETLEQLEKAAKDVNKLSKWFVCCFLTHGKNKKLLMKDSYVEIDDILKLFSRSACKNLAGKPKIFIFQACRGNCCEEGVPCDSTDGDTLKDIPHYLDKTCGGDCSEKGMSCDSTDIGSVTDIPDYLDFLLVYSTYEGKYSFKTKNKYFKEKNHGSYFIDELCRTLEQFSGQLNLLQILTIVNYRVAHFFLSCTEEAETDKKKQMPCFTSRLRTEVKFNKTIPIFASDHTKHFDTRRAMSKLGLKSARNPLEDKQIYKIENPKSIKFLYLLNKENKFGRHLTDRATTLWSNVAARGYKIKELEDWSENELMHFLRKDRNFPNTDCLICFVACQAEGDNLYDKEGGTLKIREIVEQFTGKVCSTLRGKPKIFIFLMSPLTKSSSSDESTDGGDYYNMIPVHSDLLEVAITIQESHQLDGVIKKLCNIFGEKSSEDLLSQLTRMNDELVKDYGFFSPSNKNAATFSLNSSLTETLILNKPKCKN